jgi:hypothetical protein
VADYEVIHRHIIRVLDDKSTHRFEVGDAIDPTEDELLEYPEQLKKIERVVPARERRAVSESVPDEPAKDEDGTEG